jgi:putative hydroxymethylpyrimidine transporter CytX
MQTEKSNQVTTISQMMIWFGASISIAEILTGTLVAPLGLQQGLLALIIGHLIGGVCLCLVGLIGSKSRLTSAQSISISFGKYGSVSFSLINTLQLFGWTAVMLVMGSKVLNGITIQFFNYNNEKLWCVVIGALICLWVIIGMKNLAKVNRFVITALLIFSVILGFSVFRGGAVGLAPGMGDITFGGAVELNVAMALSWMPLISDYTCRLKKKASATIATVGSYIVGSFIMFLVGFGAALYAGTDDIYVIMMTAGLGWATLLIVLFSTAATTFMDSYSIGVNVNHLNKKITQKKASVLACAIGVVIAVLIDIGQYESFLYLIGSVFAPFFAILLVDYYIFGKRSIDAKCLINWKNIIIWVIGFVIYRLLMSYNSVIGITVPVMLIIGAICFVVNKIEISLSQKKTKPINFLEKSGD